MLLSRTRLGPPTRSCRLFFCFGFCSVCGRERQRQNGGEGECFFFLFSSSTNQMLPSSFSFFFEFLTRNARDELATRATRSLIVSHSSSERRLSDGSGSGGGSGRRWLFQRQRESDARSGIVVAVVVALVSLAGARLAVASCSRRHLDNVRGREIDAENE